MEMHHPTMAHAVGGSSAGIAVILSSLGVLLLSSSQSFHLACAVTGAASPLF